MAKTTIEIDDVLLRKAMRLSAGKTKRRVMDDALRDYVHRLAQNRLIDKLIAGKAAWRITEEGAARFWEERRKRRAEAKRAYNEVRRSSRKTA